MKIIIIMFMNVMCDYFSDRSFFFNQNQIDIIELIVLQGH